VKNDCRCTYGVEIKLRCNIRRMRRNFNFVSQRCDAILKNCFKHCSISLAYVRYSAVGEFNLSKLFDSFTNGNETLNGYLRFVSSPNVLSLSEINAFAVAQQIREMQAFCKSEHSQLFEPLHCQECMECCLAWAILLKTLRTNRLKYEVTICDFS
jgi:hypothetical protein